MTTPHDATTTFLVCFSGHDDGQGRTSVQICLGLSPAEGGKPPGKLGPYFFTVNLANVRVQLPNPLPGTQPVVGTTSVSETLPLSAADVENLQAWLAEYVPVKKPKE